MSGCPAVHGEVRAVTNAIKDGKSSKLTGSTLICGCGVPCGNCCTFLAEMGVKTLVVITTEGVGLYYDDLSREYVKSGVFEVWQFIEGRGNDKDELVEVCPEDQ